MSSSEIPYPKGAPFEKEKEDSLGHAASDVVCETTVLDNVDGLQRRLGNRHIQLIAIGGSVGTALFVSIGATLGKSGPLNLLLAFTIYCGLVSFVNNSMAEMGILHPISGGFIRMAGKWVDDSLGFMVGWNFFFYEAICVPFEITAICWVLTFWRDDIPAAAVIAACTVLYAVINVVGVRLYGEAEFWLSNGKVLLLMLLFSFTFVTMVGGNPQHDAYGFRHWRNPGPMAEYGDTGSLGRFEGFLQALWTAVFCVAGPEFIAMIAAEAKRPRIYIKNAFKTVFWRFITFYIGSALFVGIVIAYNDPAIVAIVNGTSSNGSTGAGSPYVIAMSNMGIKVLPDIVNALLITSMFSAGNTYAYCATRTLYGLALEGRAPRFLCYCTSKGVPLWCFATVMLFPFLSFLSLSNGSVVVLNWLINLITGAVLVDYIVMCITYIFFYRAVVAQGVDRSTFPYVGLFQPYSAWIGLIGETLILIFYGYTSFTPWDVQSFFIYYAMVILDVLLFIFWKLYKRTKLVKSEEADLIWERLTIDAYEASFISQPVGFWTEMAQLIGLRRNVRDVRAAVSASTC